MGESRKISEIKGLKYFKPLVKLLRDLHLDGCRRDRAGNRKLHDDQYCLLVLLSYFNPMARSVRSLVKSSKLQKVQKKLGCSRASLGSFSEAAGVFDPELIKRVAHTLLRQVKPIQDVGKGHVRKKLVVDGTVLRTLNSITEAAARARVRGQAATEFCGLRPTCWTCPAEVIADIFRNRWAIEVFFRMFEHVLGCRHQLSQSPAGLEIQVYCAIIACMLIVIWTGRKPTQRTFEMVGWYMIGMASDKELTDHIESLKKQPIPKTPA